MTSARALLETADGKPVWNLKPPMDADVLWMGYEEEAQKMLFDRIYRI